MTQAPPSIRQTVSTLAGFQKTSKGAPAYSRFVNRPLGRVFAAIAYRLGLTPNQVTLISGLCSGIGIVALLVLGTSWQGAVVVTLFLVLGYALDSADGQLARLRGGGSPSGEWLDHVVDCVKISTLHLSVLVAFFHSPALMGSALGQGWLVLPLAFTVVANLYFFAYILGDLIRRTKASRPAPRTGQASVLRSLIVVPTDYGLLCVAFSLLGLPIAFAAVYGLLLLGNLGYVVLGLPKWYRDMNQLAR